MVSSPEDVTFFARSDPVNFFILEPIFEGPTLLFADREGDRRGIVSTLVVAETRRGVDIWVVLIRLCVMDGLCDNPPAFELDTPFNANIAALVFCCTSRVKSASSCGV